MQATLNGLLNHESASFVFIYLNMGAFKFRAPDKMHEQAKLTPSDYIHVRACCYVTTNDSFCAMIP